MALTSLSAACRLPKLSGLSLTLPGVHGDVDEADLATNQNNNNLLLLGLARMQLTGLRTLHIAAEQGWVDNSSAWSALGRMTQLTELLVRVSQLFSDAITVQHLSALQPLGSSLQSLVIHTAVADTGRSPAAAAAAGLQFPAGPHQSHAPVHPCGKR
jgi:hypothetical protein